MKRDTLVCRRNRHRQQLLPQNASRLFGLCGSGLSRYLHTSLFKNKKNFFVLGKLERKLKKFRVGNSNSWLSAIEEEEAPRTGINVSRGVIRQRKFLFLLGTRTRVRFLSRATPLTPARSEPWPDLTVWFRIHFGFSDALCSSDKTHSSPINLRTQFRLTFSPGQHRGGLLELAAASAVRCLAGTHTDQRA